MDKKPIWIIGYLANLSETMEVLQAADEIYARGHLVTRWFDDCGLHALNSVKQGEGKPGLESTVEAILDAQADDKAVVYATMVKPLSADVVVKGLMARQPDLPLRWAKGEDFIDEAVMAQVLKGGGSGLMTLDGQELATAYHLPFSGSHAVLIYEPGGDSGLSGVARLLRDVYPKDHPANLLSECENGEKCWQAVTISELEKVNKPVDALLLPPRSPDCSLPSFEEVIAHLRSPEGCPWDRKQTHESLRTYLLEETYETLATLDDHDMPGLQEELGDLLLQILLHAQIAVENGEFSMADVIEGINRKIVYRHPHVFGDVQVTDATGVVQNWEKLKQQERAENGTEETKGLLDGIPVSFPALAQAQSIQDRAARVGFDWKEIEPVMNKVMEEYREVQEAPNAEERAKELGDLLFAVVNLVRWYKVDAESALRETNLKFRKRFAYIEKKSRETGKPMQEMTLDEMDVFWNEAKKTENRDWLSRES
jgi:tetrapyrrole methylase family protein/MazG family protein